MDKVKNKSNGERYVNIKMVSKYTSLPVKTLYEWAAQGKIPSIKINRRVLFDLHDIDHVMASMKRNNNQDDKKIDEIVSSFCCDGV